MKTTTTDRSLLELSFSLASVNDLKSARSAVVDHLGSIIPSRGHGIYELLPQGRPSDVDVSPTVPTWFLDAYEAEARLSDPVYAGVRRLQAPVDSGRLLHWQQWHREVVYGVLDRIGFQRSLQAPVLVNGRLRGTLNVARSKTDRPFSTADLTRLGHVSSLVSAVYGRITEAQLLRKQGDLSLLALDAMTEPVVVTSGIGEVLLVNKAARRTGAEGVSADRACKGVIRQNLQHLRADRVRSAIAVADSGAFGQVTVRTSWLDGFDAGLAISHLYLRDATPGVPPLDHSPLTRRQREIVALLSRGLTVQEVASKAIVSPNTVKQHLKRIYTKMGVRSRAELVQALWQSAEAG